MIHLEINGTRFTGFEMISATKSMEAAAGTFTINIAPHDMKKLPFKNGDTAKMVIASRILVNEIPVITGYIEKKEGSFNSADDTITISGREYPRTVTVYSMAIFQLTNLLMSLLKARFRTGYS